ncbi:MAG: roadblock/LC7 domain-containing protein [Thermoplasmata archaeon]|nr:MAG: roadblock/LC7 domain-containing protein [Thermoplasmata archaeon]
MEDIKSLEAMMTRIKGLGSVTDAVLMTKTGMFVLGSIRRSISLDKFAGMAAIIMGSAEAASLEMNDPLRGLVLQTKTSKILITFVTDTILLAVTILGKQDEDTIMQELQTIISGI